MTIFVFKTIIVLFHRVFYTKIVKYDGLSFVMGRFID